MVKERGSRLEVRGSKRKREGNNKERGSRFQVRKEKEKEIIWNEIT